MFILDKKNSEVYKILNQYNIEEQNLEVVEIIHINTKAKIILFICDDENRVFNIAFKTPVSNSKGTPHILEHAVLCGSKKYNVKDPFIELAKGSLNTFLNAMTFPDKTCYPVASTNLKDFHNLVDVYLDAVFYPNAITNDKIFKQEGWHYELEGSDSELKVNGVVFNEMKGVFSSPDSIIESAILKNLYDNTNYAYESGGNPNEIIDLTYDEFVQFHNKYYSASNSIIYLYGKLDFNYELSYIQNEYLKNFEEVKTNIVFAKTNNIVKYKEQIDYYNIDSNENIDKAYIAYSFAINIEKTSLNDLILKVIDYVLFSSDAAIMKEKFLRKGYGESVYSSYETSLNIGLYSIVSQNIDETKKDGFIKLFDDTIQQMIESGLDVDKFKAGINSVYFSLADSDYTSIPRGLDFSLNSLDTYLYGQGITNFIEYKDAFNILKNINLKDKNNLFIKCLKEVFIDNQHRVINILRPKLGYSQEKEAVITDKLNIIKSKLSNDEVLFIINDNNELKNYQKVKDSDEDLKCIPSISINDIERNKIAYEYNNEYYNNIEVVITNKNDKDIVYFDVKFDITNLSREELYLFNIVATILSKVDLKNTTFHDFNNYIDVNTGGLSINIESSVDKVFCSFGLKATNDKIKCAFDIIYKLFHESKFVDTLKISILTSELKSNSLLAILSQGHVTAINRSMSNFDFRSRVLDRIDLKGIAHYRFINNFCSQYYENSNLINETLELLFKKVLKQKMYFTLSVNSKYKKDIIAEFYKFINKFNPLVSENIDNDLLDSNIDKIKGFIQFENFDKLCKNEAIITPNDINFCAISGSYGLNKYSGTLAVLKILMSYEYLWTNIRVLGGAYGCMFTYNKLGNYSFCSYRDPNVKNTNEVYFGVSNYLNDFNTSIDLLNKYIIGSMRMFDNPFSTYGYYKNIVNAFFNNITNEEYNKRRNEALDTKQDDIKELSKLFENIKSGDKCALICASKVDEAKNEYDCVWQLME